MVAVVIGIASPAVAEPNHVSVDLDEQIGVLTATHTDLTAAFARRFLDDRLYLEARVGVGRSDSLSLIEERAGIGVVLNRNERVEVLVGWRIGDTYWRGNLGSAPLAFHDLSVELAVVLAIRLAPSWRLRVTPLLPTLFWNHVYGGTIGLGIGVDRAL